MPEQFSPNQPDRRTIYGFAAGTFIRTSEGSKPVEQLRPGNVIQGRPAGEVCEVFVTRKPVLLLQLNGNVIRATPGHLFFTDKGWVDAADLRVGDLLRTRDGSWATVQAVEVEEQPVNQLVPGVMPYPSSGLLPAGRPAMLTGWKHRGRGGVLRHRRI
jgi:hypothetical protein